MLCYVIKDEQKLSNLFAISHTAQLVRKWLAVINLTDRTSIGIQRQNGAAGVITTDFENM